MTRTWLITGCSTGFGLVPAGAMPARGDRLVATERSVDAPASSPPVIPTVRTVALDVTLDGPALAAVPLAGIAFGLDVLVDKAGIA